jgi:hypothetical protein
MCLFVLHHGNCHSLCASNSLVELYCSPMSAHNHSSKRLYQGLAVLLISAPLPRSKSETEAELGRREYKAHR